MQNPNVLEIKLKSFQDRFLFSEKRFPALVAGIGTGKTMMLLLKVWRFCEEYPNSLALIVRKEYTDLHDSTIKDFERYFGVSVDSHKEYHYKNGSAIMFRHGNELNVLKNINLSIVGIEQAEEFDTEETFTFLRDRLRRNNAPYRQMCLISNANGHNWIWRLWINNPSSDDFDAQQATTFDNEDNLPKDFMDDLRKMEQDSPNHYKRFVLNDHEETDADDYLFTWLELKKAIETEISSSQNSHKILGADIARFGDDETVFTILESRGTYQWEQTLIETHRGKDLMWTVGRIIDMKREFGIDLIAVDDDGLGGGVTDRLRELRVNVAAFKGGEKPKNEEMYYNRRSEAYFGLKDMVSKGYLKLTNNHNIIDQLLTIRFKYNSRGLKAIVSKDDMRKEGIKSPDMADAVMMAASCVGKSIQRREFITSAPKLY